MTNDSYFSQWYSARRGRPISARTATRAGWVLTCVTLFGPLAVGGPVARAATSPLVVATPAAPTIALPTPRSHYDTFTSTMARIIFFTFAEGAATMREPRLGTAPPGPAIDLFASEYDAAFRKALRVIVGPAFFGSCCLHTCRVTAGESNGGTSRADTRLLAPIPFGRLNGTEPYNASGIVPVGDSRFLVVDNRSDDALYELDLDDRGSVRNPLVTRSLVVPGGGIGDMEGLTAAEEHGRTWMFVASALDRKVKKKVDVSPRGGLLRVTMGTDGSLSAENVEGFREWFVRSSSDVGGSANVEPDEHGLNIEGLAWDAARHALLFGVRSPLSPNGEPLVIPVRVKNLGGPWDTSNLEMLPAIHLALPLPGGAFGIRDMQYDASRGVFLVVVGNSVSHSMTGFRVLAWDGNAEGTVTEISDLAFEPHFKVEGVCHGTIGGRGAIIFTDDGGGYQFVWDDDPRLGPIPPRSTASWSPADGLEVRR